METKYICNKAISFIILVDGKRKQVDLEAGKIYSEDKFGENKQSIEILLESKHISKIIINEQPKTLEKPERYYNSPLSLTTQFYFCPVPLRLDTYTGCTHACKYCFANNSNQKYIGNTSLMEENTAVAFPTKLKYVKNYFDAAFEGAPNKFSHQEALAVQCLKRKVPIHFGGMSDPLQPLENKYGVTYEVLKLLKKYEYPVIFSTKGKLILDKKYHDLIADYKNFALQISLIDDRQEVIDILEPGAASVQERLDAFELYKDKWTACRIQPFIVGLTEPRIIPLLDKLKARGVNHVMVEGLKFFSGNKQANKVIGKAFKKITGKEYDLVSYYKSLGAKYSGNDIELPTWRKYKYAKVFKEELAKRGMTYGAADNDLRFLGKDACCCGIGDLPGFENTIKHNTGTAVFRAINKNENTFDKSIIQSEWFPEGTFRLPMSNEKAKKLFADGSSNRPLCELFDKAWDKGNKNSPCDQCNVKCLGAGKYKLLTKEELEGKLRFRGHQKTLF